MKIEPKFYRAHVQAGQESAALICMTYYLDNSKQFSGVEFYEVVFTTYTQFSIPSSRMATFQEELRALHQAAATFSGDRSIEIQFITERIKEAYGSNAQIDVELIQPKP
jgi:hypothetical protein